MNAQTKIRPFNSLEAYYAERDENARLWGLIEALLFTADNMAEKLAREGHDVAHTQAFLARTRKERWA